MLTGSTKHCSDLCCVVQLVVFFSSARDQHAIRSQSHVNSCQTQSSDIRGMLSTPWGRQVPCLRPAWWRHITVQVPIAGKCGMSPCLSARRRRLVLFIGPLPVERGHRSHGSEPGPHQAHAVSLTQWMAQSPRHRTQPCRSGMTACQHVGSDLPRGGDKSGAASLRLLGGELSPGRIACAAGAGTLAGRPLGGERSAGALRGGERSGVS